MRILSFFLTTLAITNVMAADSFCTKYAKALYSKTDATLVAADELNLISAVVGRVVVGCDNNAANRFGVEGQDPTQGTSPFRWYGKVNCTWPNAAYNETTKVKGLVSDVTNQPFFLGTAPNYQSVTNLQQNNDLAGMPINATAGFPSIRFLSVSGQNVIPYPATTGNATANPPTQGLIQHLVSYFANALGCKFYNNGIPIYAGIQDMKAVHKNMNITNAVWTEFATTFITTLKSFGVQQADLDITVIPFVQGFLLGANQICNDAATCDCAPPTIKSNGQCVANGTTGAPTTSAPTTTTPPTPAGNGTTSPPTKGTASIIGTSVATLVAIMGALLLAFL